MLIYIIIINYHQEQITGRAVASALASLGVQARVALVDNESDGRWARARYGSDPRVELLINPENIGFGAACNQGIERALAGGAEFVLLLNSDAVVEPDCLARLAEAAARHGLAAPKILLPDGRLYSAGGIVEPARARCRNRGIYQADRGQYDQPELLRFSSACALMISRQALASGVRFHAPYFLYYEDADFCLALGQAGWRVAYAPQARVFHLESASTTSARAFHPAYYDARNRLLFLSRRGRTWERCVGGVYLLAAVAIKMIRAFFRGRRAEARAGYRGLRDFFAGRLGPMPQDR